MTDAVHDIRIGAPNSATKGEIIELKAMIRHPMESGYRRDQFGRQIPRLIISAFECRYNARPIFKAEFHPAIAANPYLSFFTTATESGVLEFRWTDQNGETTVERVHLEVA